MGNSNNGNRTSVDREMGRMDSEFGSYNRSARGDTRNSSYRSSAPAVNTSRGLFGRRNEPSGNDAVEPEYNEGDFGRADSNRLRDEVLAGYRSGGGVNGLTGGGGSSYGGDVNWTNSAMGDTGSARGTYEDFSKTGGVDATAMRRANTMIPAFYDAYKQSAARRANTQGGYSPGFDAQQAEIGRQAGREGFNSARQTEGDIARLTQSGRLAGAGGLLGLGNMETENNQFNTSGAFNAAEGNANRRQSAGQFDRGMGLEEANFNEGRRRYNQSGLDDVYGRDRDDYYRNMDNYLQGASGRSNNAQGLIGNRTEPTSRWGAIGKGLLGAGTTALGMMGGPRMPRIPKIGNVRLPSL